MFKKASIVTIVLLLSIVFFRNHSYYIDLYFFKRIFCCSFFAYTTYIAYKNKLEWLTLMLFILAILYNPFYQLLTLIKWSNYVPEDMEYFQEPLQILSVAVILYTNYVFKNKKICDTIFDRKSKDK